ncbi:MAG: cyclophilin-like fold protein [Oscillospiraceae bacterium]
MRKAKWMAVTFALIMVLTTCVQGQSSVSEVPQESGTAPESSQETVIDTPELSTEVLEHNKITAPSTVSESAPKAVSEDGLIAVSIVIGEETFAAKFYDTVSARVLTDQMPLTIKMEDYAGQEKVLRLPYDFPSVSTQTPATIRAGELYLWSENSLVLFYTTFQNSYGGYVPIGYIEDITGLDTALGSGDAMVTFTMP